MTYIEVLCIVNNMSKKRKNLTCQIQEAVKLSGMTRYRICKILGISESTMSRFMANKGGLSMRTLDALVELLDLEIIFHKGKKTKRK